MKNLINVINNVLKYSLKANYFHHQQIHFKRIKAESPSINKEDYNKPTKTCCCSLYKMDHIIKNMQKMWSMID
jgi:hypothetical protein